MSASDRKSRTVDRLAIAAIFAVAILILTIFALTVKPAQQPVPVAVAIALSSSLDSAKASIVDHAAKVLTVARSQR
jgi:hypothetical protein